MLRREDLIFLIFIFNKRTMDCSFKLIIIYSGTKKYNLKEKIWSVYLVCSFQINSRILPTHRYECILAFCVFDLTWMNENRARSHAELQAVHTLCSMGFLSVRCFDLEEEKEKSSLLSLVLAEESVIVRERWDVPSEGANAFKYTTQRNKLELYRMNMSWQVLTSLLVKRCCVMILARLSSFKTTHTWQKYSIIYY